MINSWKLAAGIATGTAIVRMGLDLAHGRPVGVEADLAVGALTGLIYKGLYALAPSSKLG